MRDGDLWENFADLVKQRGPHTVCITKVKGHATTEMVEEGVVAEEDKAGNDGADAAADLGAMESQSQVYKFGALYCRRHKLYRNFMCKIQRFVVGLKKEEKKLRGES